MVTSHLPPTRPAGVKDIITALGLLFVGTGVLAVIAFLVPAISGWLQAALALLLFGVPGFVLKPQGRVVDELGIQLGPIPKTLWVSLLTMLVIIAPFFVGFHILQTHFLDATPQFSLDSLRRWGDTLEDTPPQVCNSTRSHVATWTYGNALWVLGPAEKTLTVSSESAPTDISARTVFCPKNGIPQTRSKIQMHQDKTFQPPAGQGLWLPLGSRNTLHANVLWDGVKVPQDSLLTGAFSTGADEDGTVVGQRSFWWLLTLTVVHLGLVALPEEWFFRGYLQGRLDEYLGTPWSIFGAPVGLGFLYSAIAFAFLHPILIPGVHRLLVFFPALLFGWLRARTGNIGAAVVVHAASNMLLAIATQFYN
jgi:membrane protease YdiL (CAAX protease family)